MNLPEFTEIEISPEKIILDLHLTHTTEAFQGHFPEYPILPGVVQLDWVIQYATHYFNIPSCNVQTFQVKFQKLISFGHLLLIILIDKNSGLLSFTYSSSEIKASSGKIKIMIS